MDTSCVLWTQVALQHLFGAENALGITRKPVPNPKKFRCAAQSTIVPTITLLDQSVTIPLMSLILQR